jgi:imidazolonepropionase-like amidohydrolase
MRAITIMGAINIWSLTGIASSWLPEGLDEELALKALSLWPAEILGVSQELGSIAKGKKADLVVYSGHPLEFRSRVEMLLVDGIKWRG